MEVFTCSYKFWLTCVVSLKETDVQIYDHLYKVALFFRHHAVRSLQQLQWILWSRRAAPSQNQNLAEFVDQMT